MQRCRGDMRGLGHAECGRCWAWVGRGLLSAWARLGVTCSWPGRRDDGEGMEAAG